MVDIGKVRGTGSARAIEANPLIHADFIGVNPLIQPDDNFPLTQGEINKLIIFDATTGRWVKNNVLFNGAVDRFKLYDRELLNDPVNAIMLLEARNIVIVNGELTLTQSMIYTGLLSNLNFNTDYWFYLFNIDLTVISMGTIRIR